MPVCDGAMCNREIPWRITPSALQMLGRNVPFSVDRAHAALLRVLVQAGCWNLSPANRAVVFKNLCTACWNKQAASWGDAATYAAARAKTVPQAIYMQVMRADFQINARYEPEAILSCAVHELMHYWSFAGVGLQAYNRRANVDWDEAIADTLGFRTYAAMYRGQAGFANYITPYNSYCDCLPRARAAFKNVFGRLYREAADCGRLPAPVCEYVTQGKASGQGMAQMKEPASERLQKALTEYLFTWFFLGPQSGVHDGKATVYIDRFLDGANLGNMFSVGNAFQPYDGHNSLHPI